MTERAWTAIVTGGNRGIGRAVVETFVAAGARVAAMARSSEPADRNDAAIFSIAVDVRDRASVERAVAAAEEKLGPIHVLVNAAGIIERTPFLDLTEQRWQEVIETNLGGTFRMSQAVAAGMIRRRSGRIINIASNNALGGSPGHQAYDASKAGVVGLTRSMAVELAPHGVWVNAVAPGWTRTDMAMAALGRPGEEERVCQELPSRRIAEPRDIAEAVLWLATETTRFLVGSILVIDGGETILL
jgi:NAD(P)-dependent dehydrogenase (short-subunit alcohol dehydrogenase family)